VLIRAGVEVIPLASRRHPWGRRRRRFDDLQVDLVIDVGANEGQYGSEVRRMGYRGQILSFEPLLKSFKALSRRADGDPQWHAIQSAIGPFPGRADLNIAANGGASSSFLPMLPKVVLNAPKAKYVGTECVVIRRLDEASGEATR